MGVMGSSLTCSSLTQKFFLKEMAKPLVEINVVHITGRVYSRKAITYLVLPGEVHLFPNTKDYL